MFEKCSRVFILPVEKEDESPWEGQRGWSAEGRRGRRQAGHPRLRRITKQTDLNPWFALFIAGRGRARWARLSAAIKPNQNSSNAMILTTGISWHKNATFCPSVHSLRKEGRRGRAMSEHKVWVYVWLQREALLATLKGAAATGV
uniref:Uncharacterized protein n=1 Tax=Sphaerodactylus townsendi TaxID=933632 RepID=A0ACB8E9I8_9SAUR